MPVRPYTMVDDPDSPGGVVARIAARGSAVLSSPMINRGTAFTPEERRALGLTGLLPSGVSTLEGQVQRTYEQCSSFATPLAKNVYLSNLRDRNEILFYRLLSEHLDEMLPIVYTPTVGTVIERFSHEFRRPRGVFLSIDAPEDVEDALRDYGLGADEVDLLVATDAEGVLGIGDQGVGGIEIAIGKLAVYTAAAGLHPRRVIPVVLDTGTDNLRLLEDELYLGVRHARVRGPRYDAFLDAYVDAATKLFPHALLHWEDFGVANARRVLQRYADRCTFNDDMQGTAAVVLAAVTAAVAATGARLRDARVVVFGAGTAGTGIADALQAAMVRQGLTAEEAARQFWLVDRTGLLTDADPAVLRDAQRPYARPADEIAEWLWTGGAAGAADGVGLLEVVSRVQPTVLLGTSTVAGAFSEPVVRAMARGVERPVVFPLSNPTSRAEAVPADLLRWTDGRALVATGSPFPPVSLDGRTYVVAQANNALVFPGIGLGVAVSRARRVSEGMLAAAADALAALHDPAPGTPLLPPVSDLRSVSAAVGIAVALAADAEGLARVPMTDPVQQVTSAMWRPAYPRVEAV